MGSKFLNDKCRNIAVLGAGACGLSSAVCIQENFPDAQVHLVADRFSPDTTSDGSGGFWYPFMAGPDTDPKLFRKIAKETFDFLTNLAYSTNARQTGTQMLSGYYLSGSNLEKDDELVKEITHGFRRVTQEELRYLPGAKDGWFCTTVQVDVTPFLKWLMERFLQNGGKVVEARIKSLDELTGSYDAVVNCTGLEARELLDDKETKPVRGQIWRVYSPSVKHFYILKGAPGETRETYILPGGSQVVVGGTFQPDDWRTQCSEEDSRIIWENALKLLPPLTMATRLKEWVGLRPYRAKLRLESETISAYGKQTQVIHNYGHGGSGLTLFWGCAKEVVNMLEETMAKGGNIRTDKSAFKARM